MLGRNSALRCSTLLTLGPWLGLSPISMAMTSLSSFLAAIVSCMRFRRGVRASGPSLMVSHQKLVLLFSDK